MTVRSYYSQFLGPENGLDDPVATLTYGLDCLIVVYEVELVGDDAVDGESVGLE